MKIKDKIEKIIGVSENDIDKYLGLNFVGTMLNLLEGSIEELNDEDISKELEEFIELIQDKREEIMNKEINQGAGEDLIK